MSKTNDIILANLKREIATGIEALDLGRCQTYNDDSIKELADDICRDGRKLLRFKVAMKARKKK